MAEYCFFIVTVYKPRIIRVYKTQAPHRQASFSLTSLHAASFICSYVRDALPLFSNYNYTYKHILGKVNLP